MPSRSYQGMPVYDDSTYLELAPPSGEVFAGGEIRYNRTFLRGFVNDRTGFRAPPVFELLTREQVAEMAKQQEAAGATIRQVCDRSGPNGQPIPSKDQDGTNFCHANSPAFAMEVNRAMAGLPYVSLSPASIANPITGGSNAGAYIDDDLKQVVNFGVAESRIFPDNHVGLNLWTPEAKENAALYRPVECWDMFPDSNIFLRCCTLVLQGVPVCTAYNWWSHAVTAVGVAVLENGRLGLITRNSWGGGYGDNGYFVLEEGKGTPDEAYALRGVYASGVAA